MCGFAVKLGFREEVRDTREMEAASTALSHRGPDDEGFVTWSPAGAASVFAGASTARASIKAHALPRLPPTVRCQVTAVHRRLAILDLTAAAHQPWVDTRSGAFMVYNGEVYNHEALRRELQAKGYVFRSVSDTEVVFCSWLEWGEDCLARLNGMFAFVLVDPRTRGVFAARDRFGIKPLYYANADDAVLLASEPKALAAFRGTTLRADSAFTSRFLHYGQLDVDDTTLLDGVRQLVPGQRGSWILGEPLRRSDLRTWYSLRPTKWSGSDQEAVRRFDELLLDSVKLQLRADVPVGTCLSGGLDSSTIACYARRHLASEGANTRQIVVTASFREPEADEWIFAREVVKSIGAESVRVWPTMDGLRQAAERFLWHQDEPPPGPSMFSQWCVFNGAANAGLKVTLDGQGSDEMLAGYVGNEAALYLRLLRSKAFRPLANEIRAFKGLHGRWPLFQIMAGASAWGAPANALLRPLLDRAYRGPRFLSPLGSEGRPRRPIDEFPENLVRQIQEDLPHLLHAGDRSSMAFGVESRVPFLDHRLVEFALGLPSRLLYANADRKIILRRATQGILPDLVRNRRDKMGFAVPAGSWFAADPGWFREGMDLALARLPELFDIALTRSTFEGAAKQPTGYQPVWWRVASVGWWLRVLDMPRPPSPTDHGLK